MTEETAFVMTELIKANDKVDKRFRYLEAVLGFRDADIKAKVRRIAELHSEIDVLNRRVEELEHELKYKDLIIQKQVIQLSELKCSR